jgi:hypothetical protein
MYKCDLTFLQSFAFHITHLERLLLIFNGALPRDIIRALCNYPTLITTFLKG